MTSMNDDFTPEPPEPSEHPPERPVEGPIHQEVQHASASARVPDAVGRGVFCTEVIVMQGVHEFVLDFLMNFVPPRRIAARIILPPTVVPLFIGALQDNLQKYVHQFGPLPRLPPPPPGSTPPGITDLYDDLKLPDDLLSGVYANTVMIVHSPAEFCFDFITSFYPRSAVSCRVFLSAPNVPQLLDSLVRGYEQYQKRMQQQRPPEPPPAPAPGEPE